MTTGLVGWILIPVAARAGGQTMPHWGHLLMSGALGGFFLGTVEGMVEESSVKTVRGGLIGALGGVLGGTVGNLVLTYTTGATAAVVLAWGITGAVIGGSSVWMERRASRIFYGMFGRSFRRSLGRLVRVSDLFQFDGDGEARPLDP